MMGIIEFFIRRPKVVNLVLTFILLMGTFALNNLNKQGYPSVDYGFVSITTVYPGASPEDVELKVTNKIEEKLKGVDGIKELNSRSLENYSIIAIQLDDSVDTAKTKADIKKAVDQVDNLPSDIKNKPLIIEINTDAIPLIEVAILGDADYGLKRKYAKALEDKFKANKVVGSVYKYGYLEKEVKVEVDQNKLISNYVSLAEVMAGITAHNFRMSAGDLKSKDNEKKLIVMSEFDAIENVGDVIVRSDFQGNRIVVSDIARIIDGYEKPELETSTNGKKSINLLVKKKPQADVIKASAEIKKVLAEFQKTLPENVQAVQVVDYSTETKDLLNLVISNAKMGFVLVIITLLVLLNFKIAFWTALGIPVSILFSLALFPYFGLTINFITLTGIIIVLGMVVDDAIIVGENIYHYREQGLPPIEAAIKGVQEVLWPVVATITTTVIVFLPMLFMKGIMGKFMVQMPIAVSLILVASLLESLFLLPAHIASIQVKKKEKEKVTIMNRLENIYEKIVLFTIHHKYKVALSFILMFAFSIILMFTSIKFRLFPSDDGLYAYIMYETKQGTSLEETARLSMQLEEKLKPYIGKYIASVVSTVGQKIPDVADYGGNYQAGFVGNIMLHLTPMNGRDITSTEIVKNIKKDFEGVKGFTSLVVDVVSDGPPLGKPITITLVSDNDAVRSKITEQVKKILANEKGVFDIDDNESKGKKRIDISFDYGLMSRLGLNAASVANTIRAAYDGVVVTELRANGEDVDFRVILNESSRYSSSPLKSSSINDVNALTVMNNQGKLIPLGQFISTKERDDKLKINHYDGIRSITIFADIDLEKLTASEINRKLKDTLTPIEKENPELRIVFGGEEKDTEEAMSSLYSALILALVGIYFILVVLFNSFTQPFLVMTAIPFSLSGVIFTFFLHNQPFSFASMIGVIGLTGVVVNDSLVMISFLNQKKHEVGVTPEKMAEAAKRRLRPILLTTITTAAGLFPTAYGFGGDNPFIVPLMLAIAWGLVFATLITLLLIPALYVIQHNVNVRFKKVCIGDRCKDTML